MDPRSFTVKPCPTSYKSKSSADIGNATSTRRDFFNSIGKIGDLEVLNSVGAGAIGTGLRTLSSISNSIRTGCGALPTAIGQSLDQGANWILENVGIAPTVIETLREFHPEVVNQALGQAKQIYQNIQSGHFKVTDIPYYLQDFQNLERLARGVYTPGDDRLNSLTPRCEASPYAIDLIARAPKYKFLFVVQFVLSPGYENLQSIMKEMAFVVKKSDRPKISYKAEDVNYYNYRSKFITKMEFDEVSMSFHDDILNNTTKFYTAYLKAMSPIANLQTNQATNHNSFEQMGMYFDQNILSAKDADTGIPTNKYAASTGPLANDNKQSIFREIVLYHVFDNGNNVTVYHFLNPRITQLIPDDVDMSIGTDGSELTITFNYDGLYVETTTMAKLDQTFRAAQDTSFYQLRNNDAASSVKGPNSSGISPYGTPIQGTDSCTGLLHSDTRPTESTISGGGFGGGSILNRNPLILS